jgi:hypothetical protein
MVSLSVTNSGGTEGKYTAALKLDGVVETTKDVTLKPGEVQSISFALSKTTAKTYQVAVDSLTTTFAVSAPAAPATTPAPAPAPAPAAPPPTISGTNWLLIGIIGAAVIIIIGITLGVAARRRASHK